MIDEVNMSQVWKFVLQPECEIEMPAEAQILSVGSQGDDICLWVRVDPAAPKEKRKFIGFGTGHDIPDELDLFFMGTAFLNGGNLVFHLFELTNNREGNRHG